MWPTLNNKFLQWHKYLNYVGIFFTANNNSNLCHLRDCLPEFITITCFFFWTQQEWFLLWGLIFGYQWFLCIWMTAIRSHRMVSNIYGLYLNYLIAILKEWITKVYLRLRYLTFSRTQNVSRCWWRLAQVSSLSFVSFFLSRMSVQHRCWLKGCPEATSANWNYYSSSSM